MSRSASSPGLGGRRTPPRSPKGQAGGAGGETSIRRGVLSKNASSAAAAEQELKLAPDGTIIWQWEHETQAYAGDPDYKDFVEAPPDPDAEPATLGRDGKRDWEFVDGVTESIKAATASTVTGSGMAGRLA